MKKTRGNHRHPRTIPKWDGLRRFHGWLGTNLREEIPAVQREDSTLNKTRTMEQIEATLTKECNKRPLENNSKSRSGENRPVREFTQFMNNVSSVSCLVLVLMVSTVFGTAGVIQNLSCFSLSCISYWLPIRTPSALERALIENAIEREAYR